MEQGWLVNYKHEGSDNDTVWVWFLISVWKLQLVWRADFTKLGEVAPLPRCLPCTFAVPGAGMAATLRACSGPPQSIAIHYRVAVMVSSPPIHTGLHCSRSGDTCQCLCEGGSDASPALDVPCELLVSYMHCSSHWWTWSCSQRLLYCLFDPSPGFLG